MKNLQACKSNLRLQKKTGNHPAQLFEKLIDVNQLSEMLGVHKKTIYGWTYRNQIPFRKIGNHLVRFSPREIQNWIIERGG